MKCEHVKNVGWIDWWKLFWVLRHEFLLQDYLCRKQKWKGLICIPKYRGVSNRIHSQGKGIIDKLWRARMPSIIAWKDKVAFSLVPIFIILCLICISHIYKFWVLWVITIEVLSDFSCRVVVWGLCRCKTSIYGSTSQNVENL